MLTTAIQEKIFTRLLSNPANARCADCGAKSPSWASIDFGVFVCLNCSGAHRALGPSVTRVRSTKLDTWQTEWIQLMELGNDLCNSYWLANIGNSNKPTASSSLDQIKRFVAEKYVKRKFAKKAESDPVTNLKTFRSLKKNEQCEPQGNDFRKCKDEQKFNTVSGGFNFQKFDFRKNSGSQQKPKKKEPSFDIFNFDEPSTHENHHINHQANINLYDSHEVSKKGHGHSLDFYPISHGNAMLTNPNFHQTHIPHHNQKPIQLQQHAPTFNELANMFPTPHSNFHQMTNLSSGSSSKVNNIAQQNNNPFTFNNVFQQPSKPQNQSLNSTSISYDLGSQNSSVSHCFDIFGGKKIQNNNGNQVPINMNINMYANNINFNFSSAPEKKAEDRKDPFGAIDQFNF